MEQNNAFLGSTPIGKLMRGYALPCIISLLVGALYNIVDQIFIANASYLGSYGNAVMVGDGWLRVRLDQSRAAGGKEGEPKCRQCGPSLRGGQPDPHRCLSDFR